MEARKKVENVFTAGVFLVVLLRFIIAFTSFGDKGVNPYIFAALDLITAYPYARYTARVVVSLANYDYPRVAKSGGWWVFWFAVPYVYLFLVAHDVPTTLWLGVGAWMGVFGLAAIVGMVRKARTARLVPKEDHERQGSRSHVDLPHG